MTQDDFTALATAHPNLTLGELRPVVFGQVLHPSPRKEGDREVHFIALRTVDRRCLIHLSVGQMARLTVSWWGQEHATKPGIQCDVTGDLADLERLWLETASLETPLLANRVLQMMETKP